MPGPLLRRDPLWFDSCKRPPPVSNHSAFAFWVVVYGRFDCDEITIYQNQEALRLILKEHHVWRIFALTNDSLREINNRFNSDYLSGWETIYFNQNQRIPECWSVKHNIVVGLSKFLYNGETLTDLCRSENALCSNDWLDTRVRSVICFKRFPHPFHRHFLLSNFELSTGFLRVDCFQLTSLEFSNPNHQI